MFLNFSVEELLANIYAKCPRSLKRFGSKEQLRDFLGDLIHALRSHIPCVYLNRDDPLWCSKVTPCLRTSYRLCHMHGCHIRGKCEDNKCRYVWKLISHWYNCENELCFVCSPWVKPIAVYGQSKTFLNELFGEEPLLKSAC
ncbi:TAZ zinc finger [Ostertagia ostertagi]